MIVVLGKQSDYQVASVTRTLVAAGLQVSIVDQAHLSAVTLETRRDGSSVYNDGLDITKARVVWDRRRVRMPVEASETFRTEYVVGDGWRLTYNELSLFFGDRTFNRLAAIQACQNKLFQLNVARSVGLSVPNTILTNDPRVLERWGEGIRSVVVKAIGSSQLPGDDGKRSRMMFTTRVAMEDALKRLAEIRVVPSLFQEEIPKQFELRISVMGGAVFAFKIDSQRCPSTALDWRIGQYTPMFEQVELSCERIDPIRRFMDQIGLFEGQFDFVVTPDGDYIFLECNPVGTWGWLDDLVGGAMARAFGAELLKLHERECADWGSPPSAARSSSGKN